MLGALEWRWCRVTESVSGTHRRHLTGKQKRWMIKQAITADPAASDHKIARKAKVDRKTVNAVRRKMVSNGEFPEMAPSPLERAKEALRTNPNLTQRTAAASALSTRLARNG